MPVAGGVLAVGPSMAIVREIAELHLAAASLRPKSRSTDGDEQSGCVARIVFPVHRPQPLQPLLPKSVQTGFA